MVFAGVGSTYTIVLSIYYHPQNSSSSFVFQKVLAFAWKFINVNWIRVSIFKIINIVDLIFKTFF